MFNSAPLGDGCFSYGFIKPGRYRKRKMPEEQARRPRLMSRCLSKHASTRIVFATAISLGGAGAQSLSVQYACASSPASASCSLRGQRSANTHGRSQVLRCPTRARKPRAAGVRGVPESHVLVVDQRPSREAGAALQFLSSRPDKDPPEGARRRRSLGASCMARVRLARGRRRPNRRHRQPTHQILGRPRVLPTPKLSARIRHRRWTRAALVFLCGARLASD